MPHLPRRAFLAASAVSAAIAFGPALGGAPPAAAATAGDLAPGDFAALRRRWRELTLGSGFDPGAEPYAGRLRQLGERARGLREQMKPTADSLFPGYPFDPPSGITQSYQRLYYMAEAWAQPGTGLTGDAALASDILRGLGHVHERVYHKGTQRYGNWWEWQIGSPRLLLDILTLLHEEVPGDDRAGYLAAVDHFLPPSVFDEYTGTSTGANRVDFCRVYAVRGALGEDGSKIALAGKSLSPVFPYVTKGDGLYADGSFIQHTWIAYSGTYGYVLLDGLGRLFALLDGTEWEVTDPKRQIVYDSVEKAYAPLLHDGLMMDSVSGRAISRGVLRQDPEAIHQSDHQRGHQLLAAVALLAKAASPAERARWHAMVRGWIERDTALPVLTDRQFKVADLARLHAVADEPGPAAPEPTGHTLFPAMARAVHRRPGWCAGIAMSSDRIAYYECGNGENPRGWHTGAGMLSWWGPEGTLDQYGDDFWPTVDWYRLPGTTVSAKRLADNAGGEWGEAKPDVRWVGGTTDGEFAAVGQHVRGLGSTLTARKSWFCADDAVICLGAGIGARDGEPVETVYDNRNLGARSSAAFSVNGRAAAPLTGLGRTHTVGGARWAHLEGHGGWVFPGGTRLSVRREVRTGAWSDINKGSVTDRISRHWLTLWTGHGTDPEDASYAYLLMPGAGPRTLAARAADREWLAIDANTAEQQGVTVPSLGLTAVNFWAPGRVRRLSSTGAASVLLRERAQDRVRERAGSRAGEVTLCAAGPERTGEPFELTWHRRVVRVVEAGEGAEVLEEGERLRLRISPGTAGGTVRCRLLTR
ncbi:polysaccharide lyase 8 family protein [Streptomyces sp. ODS28]|uniref:polysaccharide lyase 8 family protein n=1 Tax=Streptomyces sp. ODS28 TaxID=3136688 RepID=UPI0031EE2145